MVLPIVAYGAPVLRKKALDLKESYPKLKTLISNMFETMYNAYGVGLAAPQVGLPIRLFIIDTTPFSEDPDLDAKEKKALKGFKQVFINAKILNESGELWSFNEGCLSIPNVREEVLRKPQITIQFLDEQFNKVEKTFDGLLARVIQHEYDHIEGVLFTDKLTAFKKRIIKGKLNAISKGKINNEYPMKFPLIKKRK